MLSRASASEATILPGPSPGKVPQGMVNNLIDTFLFCAWWTGRGTGYKPCHKNNGAAVYVGRAATLHNPLFWSVAPTHSKFYCFLCRVKAKKANKI